jgi:ABC-type uncharacterized transport system ATPase subunit
MEMPPETGCPRQDCTETRENSTETLETVRRLQKEIASLRIGAMVKTADFESVKKVLKTTREELQSEKDNVAEHKIEIERLLLWQKQGTEWMNEQDEWQKQGTGWMDQQDEKIAALEKEKVELQAFKDEAISCMAELQGNRRILHNSPA